MDGALGEFSRTLISSLVPTISIQLFYNNFKRRLLLHTTSLSKVELISSIICFIVPILIFVSSTYLKSNDLFHDNYRHLRTIGLKYFGYVLIPILSILILFYLNSSTNRDSDYQISRTNASITSTIFLINSLIIINNSMELYKFKYLILLCLDFNNRSNLWKFLKFAIIGAFTRAFYFGIKHYLELKQTSWIFEKDLPIEGFCFITKYLIDQFYFFKNMTGLI
ncbi:uncharacterized protein KGF55_005025 [Candida pseudojiufengensis]|uniref:uncharacterized protein n=1 Tax=Candida pseudojiufengensis TaxID=497109 RepID=UPI002224A6A2|nr:uncharacterized protein KGF55_005025 [Candida pseudojiufengensis]KAI5959793.1 hypothetical protein KGF55_005025 [Candida pseudojiufengensis]